MISKITIQRMNRWKVTINYEPTGLFFQWCDTFDDVLKAVKKKYREDLRG